MSKSQRDIQMEAYARLDEANNQRRLLVNEVFKRSGGKLGFKEVEQQIGPIDYNASTKKKGVSIGYMSPYHKQHKIYAETIDENKEREKLAQKIVDEMLK